MAYRSIVRNQPVNPDLMMAVQGKKDVNSQAATSGPSLPATYVQTKSYTETNDMPDPMQHGMRPSMPPSQTSQPMAGQQAGMVPMGSQPMPYSHQRPPGSVMMSGLTAARPPMMGIQNQIPMVGSVQASILSPISNSTQQSAVATSMNGPAIAPSSVPVSQNPQTTTQPGSQLPQKIGRVTTIPKPAGIDPLSVLQEREHRLAVQKRHISHWRARY